MARPNIIHLHSHDTGRQIQPYAPGVPTPALLTGQWPHCSGMLGLAHRGFSLNDPTGLSPREPAIRIAP